MAVTITNYGRFNEALLEGRVNLAADELWVMLVTNAYSFNQHAHKFKSVVVGEVAGSGYVPGGKKVTFDTPIYDSATRTTRVPAGNLAWPNVTFSGVVGAILYVKPDSVPENAMPLVQYMAFGETVSRNSNAFYLNWPTTGAFRMFTP